MNRSMPGLPVHHQLPESTQTHVHCVGDAINHLILCHPLLLPSIFPSIRVFSNESALHIRCPRSWSFSFNISPSNEHPGLISFTIDWLDLLAVQGTLKSLLQHHTSKASILLRSAFFIAQLSHPYMTTGKTIALTRRTFVGKVMSLLFNTLPRWVITFLPKSKHLLISWQTDKSIAISNQNQHKDTQLPQGNLFLFIVTLVTKVVIMFERLPAAKPFFWRPSVESNQTFKKHSLVLQVHQNLNLSKWKFLWLQNKGKSQGNYWKFQLKAAFTSTLQNKRLEDVYLVSFRTLWPRHCRWQDNQ